MAARSAIMLLALFLVSGCRFPTMSRSSLREVSGGVAHPWTEGPATDGLSVRVAGGAGAHGSNSGGGMDITFRRAGDTQELALGYHRYHLHEVGSEVVLFGRFGFHLIEWDRVGTDDGAGLLGPSLDLGIGRRDRTWPCLVLSASRDLRFNDPDDTFLSASLGWCTLEPTRPL